MSLLLVVECSVGIVGASLPTIRPLLAKLFPRFIKSVGSASTGASSRNKPRVYIHIKSPNAKAMSTDKSSCSELILEDGHAPGMRETNEDLPLHHLHKDPTVNVNYVEPVTTPRY